MATFSRPLPPPDFRVLFESAPGSLRPAKHICVPAPSSVFRQSQRSQRPRGVRILRDSLNRVLVRNRAQDTMPIQKYDIQLPQTKGGGFEERYWSGQRLR